MPELHTAPALSRPCGFFFMMAPLTQQYFARMRQLDGFLSKNKDISASVAMNPKVKYSIL